MTSYSLQCLTSPRWCCVIAPPRRSFWFWHLFCGSFCGSCSSARLSCSLTPPPVFVSSFWLQKSEDVGDNATAHLSYMFWFSSQTVWVVLVKQVVCHLLIMETLKRRDEVDQRFVVAEDLECVEHGVVRVTQGDIYFKSAGWSFSHATLLARTLFMPPRWGTIPV